MFLQAYGPRLELKFCFKCLVSLKAITRKFFISFLEIEQITLIIGRPISIAHTVHINHQISSANLYQTQGIPSSNLVVMQAQTLIPLKAQGDTFFSRVSIARPSRKLFLKYISMSALGLEYNLNVFKKAGQGTFLMLI